MTAVTAIVFDLDGTLINSAPDLNAVADAVLAREGVSGLSLHETRSFIGNGTGVFVERMMTARGLGKAAQTHARLLADFTERYKTATQYSDLYPGVIDALKLLQDRGHRLGLCTNKPVAPTDTVLSHFGLRKYFDAVLGGDSLPQIKPDPAPLLKVFELLKAPVAARLYVGDSEVDAATALNAGVVFALFTQGYRKSPVSDLQHRFAFDRFSELPQIVTEHFSTTLETKE